MHSEYFVGVVENIISKEEKYLESTGKKRVGLFKREAIYIEKTRLNYSALCLLKGVEDFKLLIPLDKETYTYLQKGDNVSVHLNFEFDFACFHPSVRKEKEPKIIEVKR
jgi:hypothetical protein